ncbi:hypothetical protein, partial [Companilactobacillus nantensis]|uniref:hypothetical protein n=1 Tax=Companilactobacillus nantensis TaxID=305793 RepID=UPI001C99D336
ISSVFCFRLPSDSALRQTPLSSANDSDYYGSQWTFTTKLAPMPGAHKKDTSRYFSEKCLFDLFINLYKP